MKLFFSLLLLLFISIESIQSKKPIRTYVVQRDNPIRLNILSAYTVYDSTGKKALYRLKTTSTDIDTIIVVPQPESDMIANMEGEWVEKVFNVTFSLPDKNSNKWIDGVIRKEPSVLREKFSIKWNGKSLHTKTKFWSGIMQIFDSPSKQLLARIKKRSGWLSSIVKFDIQIYSNYCPDVIYFFLLAINDHRYQISKADR